jgi:hypothetical protein
VDPANPVVRDASNCGSDSACVCAALSREGYALGVRAILSGGTLLLELVDAAQRNVLARSMVEISSQNALDTVAEQSEAAFDRAAPERAGLLVVETVPPDAIVTVGDGEAGDSGLLHSFTLRPGRVRVRARREGFFDGVASAQVIQGRETRVTLALVEIPKEGTLVESPWLWAGIVAAVAGGVAIAFVLANQNDATTTAIVRAHLP